MAHASTYPISDAAGTFEKKLSGHVEVDETFIGGSARNLHISKRKFRKGFMGKVAVMGLLDRHSREVRLEVLDGTSRGHVDPKVRKHIEAGSTVYTDMLASYNKLETEYVHNVINHAEKYVEVNVHTNRIENFWALLKRSIKGTYISVEPFHLFRYLDEQAFRFNKRKLTDGDRFSIVIEQILGRRLTYAELTGKIQERREPVPC